MTAVDAGRGPAVAGVTATTSVAGGSGDGPQQLARTGAGLGSWPLLVLGLLASLAGAGALRRATRRG
ncbi:hypothetical protein [Auraticoccus cholistanensis]|uniref:hypothetical protein n=1 Tax=Auraticoccus cholistanensis TaxID=2656650 RepID=UPI0018D2223A|nr:hypothetical protein [Auraticoccus cholistanensis]